jgi:putative transcriptional regulator
VDSLRGRLLVAAPPLVDPNFDRTVVLMLEHGDEGALGIVLNRPSETALDDVLPEWRPLASDPTQVFVGGPVSPDSVIALASGGPLGTTVESFVPILDDLGTIDLGLDPLDLGAALEDLRVFVGYAGWGPGQVEGELEADAWFVTDLARSDPFSTAPETLWRTVLRRQRGRLAMFANYPADAGTN